MKKKALGKGIEALIPAKKQVKGLEFIALEKIKPNKFQPRLNFDPEKHTELVSSIKEKGLMQPLIVREAKAAGDYELIAGERRLRALKELNIAEAPVIVKEARDPEALELSIIENIQREELNPIEEAHAYERLIEEFDLTQEEIAQQVGKNRSTVANMLRLLKLPTAVQDYVSRGTITMGHARAIAALDEPSRQIKLSELIANKGLSVREAEQYISKKQKKPPKRKAAKDPYLTDIEQQIQQSLGTKVAIKRGKKRGRIEIEFYSDSDLERLIKKLT